MSGRSLEHIRSILIVALQGIGNTILSVPAINAIRRSLPEAEIYLVIPDIAQSELFARVPSVDRVVYLPRERVAMPSWISKFWPRRPDLAVVAFPGGRRSALLSAAVLGKRRVGHVDQRLLRWGKRLYSDAVPVRPGIHDRDQNLALVKALGIQATDEDLAPVLELTPEDRLAGAEILERMSVGPVEPLLGVHPGCDPRFPEKKWPEQRYADLCRRLYKDAGLRPLLLGGPREQEITSRIHRMLDGMSVDLGGKTNLLGVASILERCAAFVGNDSGLMNIAAALGIPTVGLFGPSESSRTGPLGPRSLAVISRIQCSPCYRMVRFGGCPHSDYPCMRDIAVDEVYKAVLRVWKEEPDRQ